MRAFLALAVENGVSRLERVGNNFYFSANGEKGVYSLDVDDFIDPDSTTKPGMLQTGRYLVTREIPSAMGISSRTSVIEVFAIRRDGRDVWAGCTELWWRYDGESTAYPLEENQFPGAIPIIAA